MRSRASNDDPTLRELRRACAKGAFPEDVQRALLQQPDTIGAVARQVLEQSFPETLHQDLLDAVGLSDAIVAGTRRRRDPNFRNAVLVAYQYRCAMCGLDLRLGTLTVGLEAAHIKWHQARGPDSVDNGTRQRLNHCRRCATEASR
jgi:putative restriction endonuclease